MPARPAGSRPPPVRPQESHGSARLGGRRKTRRQPSSRGPDRNRAPHNGSARSRRPAASMDPSKPCRTGPARVSSFPGPAPRRQNRSAPEYFLDRRQEPPEVFFPLPPIFRQSSRDRRDAPAPDGPPAAAPL